MYFGGNGSCCSNSYPSYPYQNYGWNNSCGCGSNSSSYAIVLVLFILLVIVIGSRFNR